ncbi:MAG TPA: FtsQ-type POTRA domain-containing protein [Jatrophihabitans sp.]|nr:FtsQ-type POTRA domain-containing protein [Jatrophihabitans sp.]
MTGLAERTDRTGPATGQAVLRGRRWPVLAAVLALALGVGWLVGFSSVFGVRTVAVSGEHRVSSAQIVAAARLRHGAPLARLDTAAVRARIAAIPAVRTVTVGVSYPGTVRIRVTERVAVGYRPDADGVVLVDAAAVQFATLPRPPGGLPELAVTGDPVRSAAAATVAAALPAGFAGAVARIAVPTVQSITLTLTDGRTVLWGGTDRSAEKAKLVPVLVHQPGSYFDVSDPSSVISRSR